MQKIMTLIAVLVLVGFAVVTQALAQRGIMWRGGGWVPGTPYARMYNPQTVETIRGEVVSVGRVTPLDGGRSGVRALVKTDRGTISVHLGPARYVQSQMGISPRDTIEVRGSRITFEGEPAILAAEVKKAGQDLVLWNPEPLLNWCTK